MSVKIAHNAARGKQSWPRAFPMVKRQDACLDELFKQILAWDGVITGEHGIGLAKKPWWNIATSPESRALHRAVKKALDPKGILNPGKFVE